MTNRKEKVDPRDIRVSTEMLVHIAHCPVGGSGEGSYVIGRIQSMAREILAYRQIELQKEME